MKTQEQLDQESFEATMKMADNFSDSTDLYHPDYGWILKDKILTEEGKKYFEDQKGRRSGRPY